jgi:predicted transcriptional regulator
MARSKKNLEKLLKILDKKPMTRDKIQSTLNADRKTIYRNITEAQRRGWIQKDSSNISLNSIRESEYWYC